MKFLTLVFIVFTASLFAAEQDLPTLANEGKIPPCAIDLSPELDHLRVPGLSAAIVKNGRIACTAVAGFANIEKKRPVKPSDAFWWASVSKPVAAVAALSVWEEGKFKLSDDVNQYLPYQVKHPNVACNTKPITFQNLLTHTSSIFEDESLPAYKNGFVAGKPRQPLGEYLKDYLLPGGATYEPGHFMKVCPGEVYQYSSLGYGLLGFTIESIENKSFDQVAKERIFTPLGMNNTSFSIADMDVSRVAMLYTTTKSGFVPVEHEHRRGHREHANYPDGSLRSSTLDLARFLIMSMQFGEYQGTRILSKATVEEMFRPQNPTLNKELGHAFFHEEYGPRKVIGHDGWDPGANSLMYFDSTDNAGILLVANGEWSEDEDAEELLVKLFAESFKY